MEEKRSNSRRDVLSKAWLLAAGAVTAGFWRTAKAAQKTFKKKEKAKVPRWAMIMDLRRCTNVRACTVACKAENKVPLGSWNTMVKEVEISDWPNVDKEFLPRMCNHCEGDEEVGVPPCVKICPKYPDVRRTYKTPGGEEISYLGGATYKRPDGLVLVDNTICIGCGKCMEECPYGARSYNKLLFAGGDPAKNGIAKCTFCVHRIDNGVAPACVEACPHRARLFGDLNDPESEVSKLAAEFHLLENKEKTTPWPEYGTRPQVYYIDPKGVLGKYKVTTANKELEFRDLIT
jgi:tetrathionate reductase subunit B